MVGHGEHKHRNEDVHPVERFLHDIISAEERVIFYSDAKFEEFLKSVVNALPIALLGINPAISITSLFASWVLSILGHQAIHKGWEYLAKGIVVLHEKAERSERRIVKKIGKGLGVARIIAEKLFELKAEEIEKLSVDEKRRIIKELIDNEEKRKRFENLIMKLFDPKFTLEDFRNEFKKEFGVDLGRDIELLDFLFQFKDLILSNRMIEILRDLKVNAEALKRIEEDVKITREKLKDKLEWFVEEVKETVRDAFIEFKLEDNGFKIFVSFDLPDELDYVGYWRDFSFDLDAVLMNADAPREINGKILELLKDGKNVFVVGDSFSGKSVLLMRAMVDASEFYDVVLYNDGEVAKGSKASFESGLRRLSEKKRVLVVVDDAHLNPWIFKVVSEFKENENVTFLISATKHEYDLLKGDVLIGYGLHRSSGVKPRDVRFFERWVEIIDNLELTERDMVLMVTWWMRINGKRIDREKVKDIVEEAKRERITVVGDFICWLVYGKTSYEGFDIVFNELMDKIDKLRANEDLKRKIQDLLVFMALCKVVDVDVKEDIIRNVFGFAKSYLDVLTGLFLRRNNGSFEMKFHRKVCEHIVLRIYEECNDLFHDKNLFQRIYNIDKAWFMGLYEDICFGFSRYYGSSWEKNEKLVEILLEIAENKPKLSKEDDAWACYLLGSYLAGCIDEVDESLAKDLAEKSERYLRMAIEKNPRIWSAYGSLVCLLDKHWDKLGLSKEEAIEITKEISEKQWYCWDIEKAKRQYEMLIDSKNPFAYYNLVGILFENWEELGLNKDEAIEEAKKLLEKAIELDLNLGIDYSSRAELYYKHYDKLGLTREEGIKRAHEDFEKALKLDPDNLFIHISFANFLIDCWKDLGLSEDEAVEKIEFHLGEAWKLKEEVVFSLGLNESLINTIRRFLSNYFSKRFEETRNCKYLFALSQLLKDVEDESWKEKLRSALELYERLSEGEKLRVKDETEKLFSKFGWSLGKNIV